jgi:hypothetical protein
MNGERIRGLEDKRGRLIFLPSDLLNFFPAA